ncbi:MAG: InlB B-repeat-containing protein [Acetatifactor sp.]|nr:InlB B-repeat-containing protein [Acetatifactor sp.]
MYETGNKRIKQIYKWIASVLTIALLINESGISALAAEISELDGCICDVCCNADSFNEDCPVCMENYEECNAAEAEEVPTTEEMPEQQEGDMPETSVQDCICDVCCNADSVNEDCPVCMDNYGECNAAEAEEEVPATEEAPEQQEGDMPETSVQDCICDVRCNADSVNEDCPVCMENYGECNAVEEEQKPALEETPEQQEGEIAVATQEELAEALLAGVPKITLTVDISLTTTMIVPATADIVLDGQGFTLQRGTDEDGVFIDTMLYLSGAENAEDTNGSLTLTNICVDGQTVSAVNRAGSSAIIDFGNLILDEGAVVKSNFNYGTYESQKDGGITGVINDYGGGIQVYGELTVTEHALVTGNFADELGGGVYLAEGAALYFYADVIRENTVADDSGYGADLYASNGSTIYYDTEIDITREGLYLCKDVNMIGMDIPVDDMNIGMDILVDDMDTRVDSNVEIFLNISEYSGYTKEQIEWITRTLEEKGYKVLTNRTDINTTDLRDWYVYDHYEQAAWDALGETWESEYGDGKNPKRGKYLYHAGTYYYNTTVTDPVYTIAEWLKRQDDYYAMSYGSVTLAQFKEHIYSRSEAGYPMMTFVGYGNPAYADFLFYDPESDGEKVVNFDVDSSQVNTHTLAGNGFLVNTGIKDGKLYGYLVYYAYITGTAASSVSIYQLDGISAEDLHNKTNYRASDILGTPVKYRQIQSDEWNNQMSIQIKATPTKIEVRQQPKESESDIDQIIPILECELSGSEYSGFGPLVDYSDHGCMRASSFTFSNLRMYFTNPQLEAKDILNSLEQVDFTQLDTQKYFINLLGNSDSEYNDTATFGQYQEFLKMMQIEGIALVSDKNTPFEDYLGNNLLELNKGDEDILPVESLVDQIIAYIESKTTTYMEDKLQQGEDEDGLKNAEPPQSVGNLWLKSVSSGKQIRTLSGDAFPEDGFSIQPMDNIAFYVNKEEGITVQYDIIKPNGEIVLWETVSTESEGQFIPSPYVIPKDRITWPAGQYTVRQIISNSSICGYAYFELQWKDTTAPGYEVTINVQKDGSEWGNSGKRFALSVNNAEPFLTDLEHIVNGTYKIHEILQTAGRTVYADTGVIVTVNGANAAATVDYYTVTFHDGDTVFDEYGQIVLKGAKVVEPSVTPTKDGCNFYGWGLYDSSGEKEFSFETPIKEKTDLYAKWLKIREKTFTISVSVGEGGTVSPNGEVVVKSGASQQFVITPNDGYQIDTVLVDDQPVQLENVRFLYRTLSESAGTEMNADNTNAKQYIFKNVTRYHTLSVTFEALPNENPDSTSDTLQPDIVPKSASNGSEPKTGDTSYVEVYVTISMIAGLSYLLLYFADGESGMTEEEKKEIVGTLIKWGRKGKLLRRYVALAIIFVIMVYYHSVGKMHDRGMERVMYIK